MTTTIDFTDAETAAATYSDVYKEQHGIRPRWMRWEGVAANVIWAAVDALIEEGRLAHEIREADRAEQAARIAEDIQFTADAVEDAFWASIEVAACRKSVARLGR